MQDYRQPGAGSGRSGGGAGAGSSSSRDPYHSIPSPGPFASLISPVSASTSSSSSSSRPAYSPDDGVRRPSASADPRYRRDVATGHHQPQQQLQSPGAGSAYNSASGSSSNSRARSPRPTQPPRTRSSDRRPSEGLAPSGNGSPQSPNSPYSPRLASMPLHVGTSLWATKDLDEDLKRVNLDKCNSGEAIQETIFTRLEIGDNDAHRYELRLTTVDGDAGRPTTTDELWEIWSSGRGKGRAVYVREVVPGRPGGDDDDDLPVGMSAERLSQASRARAREEREYARQQQSQSGRMPSHTSSRQQLHSPPNDASSPRPPNEFDSSGASILRSDRPSWTWGPSQRTGHTRSSSSGNQGGLSPPLDSRHERTGSLTPTPDEFGRAGSSDWGHSPPIASTSRFETFGGHSSSSSSSNRPPIPPTLAPAGGNAPPATSQSSWSRASPAAAVTARAHQFLQSPGPTSRALPPNDPRAILPQYQSYAKSTRPAGSGPVFHNLALQQAPSPHPPPPPPPSHPSVSGYGSLSTLTPGQRTMMSKSVDNLRGQYASSDSAYRSSARGVGPPPPMPPVPPSHGSYGSQRQGTAPPSLHHASSYSPVPFNPRVMAQNSGPPPASSYYRSGLGGYTSQSSGPTGPPPPPLPPRKPYSGSSQPPPGQVWPAPQRRASEQTSAAYATSPAPRLPDVTRRLDLHPGETLQQAGSRQRRLSDAPPPTAAHMVSHDPSAPPGSNKSGRRLSSSNVLNQADSDRYGHESQPPKRDSGGSSVDGAKPKLGSGSKSLQASVQQQHLQHGREGSSSSFASSASSVSASSVPTRWRGPAASHAATPDDSAYGGLTEDERPIFASPPSSARSSTSASLSGPLTPAQDNPPSTSGGASSAVPTVVLSSGGSAPLVDSFGDPIDEETSTWFPVNQPSKCAVPVAAKPNSAPAMRKQMSAPPLDASKLSNATEDEGHTMRGDEWAKEARKALMERMNLDGGDEESTLMRLASSGSSPASSGPLSATTPASASKGKDEFGDDIDEEGGTFMPGFGPVRATSKDEKTPVKSNSTTPQPLHVSFSLKDEPASRVSTPMTPMAGTPTTKRPNLRLEMPSEPGSLAGPTSKLMMLSSSGSSSNPSPSSSSAPRRSAGDNPDVASMLSSRRAERSEKIRASSTKSGTGDGLNAASPGQVSRRNSFRARAEDENSSWAIRPAVETVLENLDVFFPDVDLDKPAFEMPTPAPGTPSPGKESGPSPPVSSSSASTTPSGTATSTHTPSVSTGLTSLASTPLSPAVRRVLHHGGLSHKKSIRVVAQDRKRAMQKAGRNVVTAVHGLGSNLLRRKSTKLFGARIEEVTGADLGRLSNTIREFPDEDPENFSYKWIKGDLIGRGSFGHVYIGFSVNTGETIAVKQVELPKTQSDASNERTKSMVASLRGEIELLKDLDHPNIVLYLGMEQTPTHLSIFLEYVPGGSIGRIVRTHGKFEEDVIKFFTMQILEGLSYLHGLGILHRDMKADNILTDHDGMCKISDFGTSKKSTDIYNNDENMSMMQGSLFWMAPEVIYNMKTGYSAKADIWSFGCILIEMFAGRRPWSDEEQLQAMFKIATERRRPPIPADVTLSDKADQFINGCLAINADERPKAFELLRHPFLTLPDGWSFTETSLYSVMANEEKRRQSVSSTASST